ncbi:MAG: hypothetical protein AB1601_14810 [Planctomycetota bacterium]
MRRLPRAPWRCALVAAGAFLMLVGGCRSAAPANQPAAAPTTPSAQPADALTPSDTNRAQTAIREDQRAMSGERRPADPGRERVVDQPRVGERR